MMPRHSSLCEMALLLRRRHPALGVAALVGIGEVHERQRRLLRRQVVGRLFRDLLAVVAGAIVHADRAGRHDVAQLGLAGEERGRQARVGGVREDRRRLDVALARPPRVPGQAMHLGLDAREHRRVRRQRRGVADGQRVIAVGAALAEEVVPLQVQRGHGVGAQPVLADDEDMVDLRPRLLRRAASALSAGGVAWSAAGTALSRPPASRRRGRDRRVQGHACR